MKKTALILIIILSIVVSCEKENRIAELGKQVPNYTFNNVLNSDLEQISIQDLKGKTVILEFWATWCGSCIPAMKELDSLQKEFENDLKVITISSENKKRLNKFIKSTNISLIVVSDTSHYSNFKYQIIPHSIIIDKKGIVRAITSPENINRDVINKLISKNEISLDLKDDFYVNPELKVKTIKSISNQDYKIELKSYNQEKRGGSKILKDIDGNINGIEMWNSTIPRLYQTLFDISSPSRMIYKDGLSKKDFPYNKEHQYNMTIEVSNKYHHKWKKIGIDFLNENFDVNAKIGIDSLTCFVLRNVDNTIKKSTSNSSQFMFMGTIIKSKKIKMSQLAKYIENFTSIPVLDKTDLKDEYDIEFEWQEEDPNTLHTVLKEYGLDFEKSNNKLPVKIMEIYRKKQNITNN